VIVILMICLFQRVYRFYTGMKKENCPKIKEV
jgi:hypothetical protein